MTNHPAAQPVTVEVDLQVKTPEQRTPALLSNATGDVSPGQLVLATDGDDALPAIVDQIDAKAGTMLLSVLWDTEPPAADPGTENLRLAVLPPDVREKALRIMLSAAHHRNARLRSELEQLRRGEAERE
jgi:hypothetical protein